MTRFLVEKRKVLDAKDVSWQEILQHSFVNFLYGFTGGTSIAFLTLFVFAVKNSDNLLINLILFFIGLFSHYQIESKILNRNKYVTKLGRNVIFPLPKTIGFILGAYLSTLI